MPEGILNSLVYKGRSMYPTLQDLDLLQITHYGKRKITCGDVVIFPSPQNGKTVVHRVTSMDCDQIRTKGDNNGQIDQWVLKPQDIQGYVSSARRANKHLAIYSGWRGRIFAATLKVFSALDQKISLFLHTFYQSLAHSGIVRCLCTPWIKTKIVSFQSQEGIKQQILLGRLIIGQKFSPEGKWQIRRPFKLFIDESSLP